MKRFIPIAAVALFGLSFSALAEDAGAYFGGGFASPEMTSNCADGTYSNYGYGSYSDCHSPSSASKDSNTFQLVGGYQFDQHFGIEAGYSRLGTYRVFGYTGGLYTNLGQFKATAFTLAVRGGKTYSNGFSVFGKLGLASVRTQYKVQPGWTLVGNADQRSSGFVGGVAGQYNVNETVGFRVSLELVKYTDSEFANVVALPGLMMLVKF